MSDVKENESEKMKDRRVVKCRGCKSPTNEHHWGIPSKFCEGFEKSSPMKGEMVVQQGTSTETLDSLKADLQALDIEEEEAKLREKIEAKRHSIHDLNARTRKLGESSRTLKSKDLPHLPHEEEPFGRPADAVRSEFGRTATLHRVVSSAQFFPTLKLSQASEMFFKPWKIAKG